MTPEEIKSKLLDVITNQIKSADNPDLIPNIDADLHDVLTAKMRNRVHGVSEPEAVVDVEPEPEVKE